MRRLVIIMLLPMLLYSQLLLAESALSKTQWQLGAALAALQIPLYPGSSESRQYLLPLPYLKVRSEYLDVDQGIRAKLFHSQRVRLSMSADLGVPVSSKDSRVRQGMPNLETVVQLGPLLEINLLNDHEQLSGLRFELPIRYAFASDIRTVHNLGLVYEPRLTYQRQRVAVKGVAWELTAGLRYSDRAYNAYYYDVSPAYATVDRPQFASASGYGGRFVDAIISWRDEALIYWSFLRYQNLSGAVFETSPLVERNSYYFFGAGITWVFAQSF